MNTLIADWLRLDPAHEVERIATAIRTQVSHMLRRRGVVLGLSGGIDSSVCAALCVRALTPDRVFGLLMPEADSSSDSTRLGQLIGDDLGIQTIIEDVSGLLEMAGCYSRRDAAIQTVIPQYTSEYKSKIVLGTGGYRLFSVVVESPEGAQITSRLTADAYLTVLAATNFKQRVRKMIEYHYADRLQYAVVGTPNRLEYDQGFFVKNGDGAADLKPIAHLYKSQVYQLAEYLGIPDEIRRRPPTTDTYSLAQSQEEFYFSLPYPQMDLCLYGFNHRFPPERVAAEAGLTRDQVARAYEDIKSKRTSTNYLHTPPVLVEPVPLD